MATSSSTNRTYADAIRLLNSLQSNRTVVSSISDASRDMNVDAIPEMLEWTRRAGYKAEHFAEQGLRCIHVAGTKGKGSVCVIVENMLLQYRPKDPGRSTFVNGKRMFLGKIGLYTSPHLMDVRERIRIDGSPISESLFTRSFFELWDRFSAAALSSNRPHTISFSSETKPGYFRYLTLLAMHVFVKEGVETAIVECGIGGEYDSTNILPPEAVTACAITRLGIDHVGMLGNTIEEIAWHKAGIMKKHVPVFTITQLPEAHEILKERAAEKSAPLSVIPRLPSLDRDEVKIGLDGDFQKDNASLAVIVAVSHLQTLGIVDNVPSPDDIRTCHVRQLPEKILHGLETVTWQGRWQVQKEGNIEWYIDGAHTVDSIQATAHWYCGKVLAAKEGPCPPTATMLIFNQQDRDPEPLLWTLLTNFQQSPDPSSSLNLEGDRRSKLKTFPNAQQIFTYAAFCTNTPFKAEVNDDEIDLSTQKKMAKLYGLLDGNALNVVHSSIEEAVELARRVAEGDERLLVLVTGSLHLVGGLLKVLEKQAEEQSTEGIRPLGTVNL